MDIANAMVMRERVRIKRSEGALKPPSARALNVQDEGRDWLRCALHVTMRIYDQCDMELFGWI